MTSVLFGLLAHAGPSQPAGFMDDNHSGRERDYPFWSQSTSIANQCHLAAVLLHEMKRITLNKPNWIDLGISRYFRYISQSILDFSVYELA
jgi:hypothetical protein